MVARLGFVVEREHQFESDFSIYLFLRRDDCPLHLSEHLGDTMPNSLGYLHVDDLEAIATEFSAEIIEQPWAREVHLSDPDGNRLRIGQLKS